MSLVTAPAFVGYFTPIRVLVHDLFTLQLDASSAFWVLFFSAASFLNAGLPDRLGGRRALGRAGPPAHRHLRRLRHAMESQQASMPASAARHFPASTRAPRPGGGYFLWFEFPEQVDSLQLFQLALAQGISLASGQIFSATSGTRRASTPWKSSGASSPRSDPV